MQKAEASSFRKPLLFCGADKVHRGQAAPIYRPCAAVRIVLHGSYSVEGGCNGGGAPLLVRERFPKENPLERVFLWFAFFAYFLFKQKKVGEYLALSAMQVSTGNLSA